MALCVIMVLLVLSTVDSVSMTRNYALTKQNEENRSHYMQAAVSFQIKADAIKTVMTSLSFDSSVQQVMLSKRLFGTAEGWDNFLKMLFSYAQLETGIDSALVVDNQGTIYNYVYYHDTATFHLAVDYAVAHSGDSPVFELQGRRMITISQPIFRLADTRYADLSQSGKEIGWCVFVVDLEQMLAPLGWQSSAGDQMMCILDAAGRSIAQNQGLPELMQQYISEHYPMNSNGGEEYIDTLEHDGKPYALYSNRLGESGWTLICFSPADVWSTPMSGILVRMIATWIVAILLTLLLISYLFRNILGFVAHMQKHMRRVRDGHMDQKMAAWKRREFAAVSDGFNDMMARVISLTQQNLDIQAALYREEVDKRQVALIALQSQVNPHFLYNTLECMKGIAMYYDVREIPVICESLAHLMRYSIKGSALSTLKDELQCVKSYLSIQNIRFDHGYKLNLDVPDALLGADVLKMVLQPLVENAILHGFELKPGPGTIRLQALLADATHLIITVEDDGCGMNEAELAAVIATLTSASVSDQNSASIGLANVAQRLKLYYGDEGMLRIHSEVGQGTRIEVHFPLSVGETKTGDV